MTTDNNIFRIAHYFIDELHIQGPLINLSFWQGNLVYKELHMLNGKLQVMGLNKTSDNYVIISEID